MTTTSILGIKELFKYFTHNAGAEISGSTIKAWVMGNVYEFDFSMFGRYARNLMALWASTGGGIYHPLPHTHSSEAYVFNNAYDQEFIRDVGDGFTFLAVLDDETLESLFPRFKTSIYKSVIKDMLCIRREQRRCPPLQTND